MKPIECTKCNQNAMAEVDYDAPTIVVRYGHGIKTSIHAYKPMKRVGEPLCYYHKKKKEGLFA